MARHGAAGATHGQRLSEQEASDRFSPEERARYLERQARREERSKRRDDLRDEAKRAIDRSQAAAPTPPAATTGPVVDRMPLSGRPAPTQDVTKELVRAHGKERGRRSAKLFSRAAREFANEQFEDARRTLRPLVDANPDLADLRELYGLALYRLGKWQLAIDQLERFRVLSRTSEQNPVLMDAHRALGNWDDVEWLWRELGDTSPSAELMVEARIVRAGADADRGRLDSAIRVLEKGWKPPKEPREHHLRRAYALADLLERDGKLPKSRRLFEWIESREPGFGDVADRIRQLQ